MSEDVTLSNISMDFGNFRAVDNVNITIKAGEFFSFLGPSGCGKTTILRLISGFMDPTAGKILIGGKDMTGTRPNERPTALIFQNLALFPLMPIWENIAFGLEVRGIDKATRRKKAEELLKLVDLKDSADKKVSQLSGGQKQRVAIARALAVEPKVMLLDEPLSALDLKLRQHMRAELRAIQKRTGVTFIYITHDQGEALAMSDRVGVMSQGVLQQVSAPNEIYNNPANGFVASFVGENNIFDGKIKAIKGGMASFETSQGVFDAKVGPGVEKNTVVRLYVRPEHSLLAKAASKTSNSIPVEVTDLAFEGNFINVFLRDAAGHTHMAQMQNDPNSPLPSRGSKLHMNFDGDDSLLLVHAKTRG
ncbi:MAG: ABC transporter ATP-binding protein [Alphaproteobacteria bacterium]|nr:ABC transporter ATP-binding protein [Alphaproteobacteria bacterium]